MAKPGDKPPMGDIEDPTEVKADDLVSKLQGLGRDIGFGAQPGAAPLEETVSPAGAPPAPTPMPKEPLVRAPARKPEMDNLQLKLPRYLMQELARTAVDRRVTKKFLVMEALRNAGFRISPEDLQEDGRRER